MFFSQKLNDSYRFLFCSKSFSSFSKDQTKKRLRIEPLEARIVFDAAPFEPARLIGELCKGDPINENPGSPETSKHAFIVTAKILEAMRLQHISLDSFCTYLDEKFPENFLCQKVKDYNAPWILEKANDMLIYEAFLLNSDFVTRVFNEIFYVSFVSITIHSKDNFVKDFFSFLSPDKINQHEETLLPTHYNDFPFLPVKGTSVFYTSAKEKINEKDEKITKLQPYSLEFINDSKSPPQKETRSFFSWYKVILPFGDGNEPFTIFKNFEISE